MNEVKEQIIKGTIVNKEDVLKNPQKYAGRNLMCLEFGDEYLNALLMFGKEVDLNKPLEVILHPWPEDPTDRAKRFFFTLRDRVCKASGDESKDYKDHIYRVCLESLMMEFGDSFKNSLSQLNKQELWQATEAMFRMCFDADAYVGDLQTEFYQVKEILK